MKPNQCGAYLNIRAADYYPLDSEGCPTLRHGDSIFQLEPEAQVQIACHFRKRHTGEHEVIIIETGWPVSWANRTEGQDN